MQAETIASDPCDGWHHYHPYSGGLVRADRAEPLTLENFCPRTATPVLAKFLREIRTDWGRWAHDLEWTLESGPEDAPSRIEILVPYSYSGGSSDFFAGGCWNPGDSPEAEIGLALYWQDGARIEIALLEAEEERIIQHIHENPPEEGYDDDY